MSVRRLGVVVAVVLLAAACRPAYDFDNDGYVEYGYVDGVGRFWIKDVAEPIFVPPGAGYPVPGDYDGDKVYDPALVSMYQPGAWYIDGEATPRHFGPADVEPGGTCPWWHAVPGNWDPSDDHWELAWYQECDAIWYVEGAPPVQFGIGGDYDADEIEGMWYDVPVPADYDGDGAWEIAVFRVLDGTFRTLDDGIIADFSAVGFPAPADYTTDPGVEPALYAPAYPVGGEGRYLIDGQAPLVATTTDDWVFPAPADYDGEAEAEPVLWNEETGSFWTFAGEEMAFPASARELPTTVPLWLIISFVRLSFVHGRCWAEATCPPGVDVPTPT